MTGRGRHPPDPPSRRRLGALQLRFNTVTIDAANPLRLAGFWAAALDWLIVQESSEEVLIAPDAEPGSVPGAIPLLFLRVPDTKTGKNRLHFDLVPDDQADAVRRLEELGARRTDIGQGNVSWVVMADPEDNEFCVLRSYVG